MIKYQYRVVWRREGHERRVKEFATLEAAERRVSILNGTPEEAFLALGINPDEEICCNGYMCGCQGETYGEKDARMREQLSPIEYIRLEERRIGPWMQTEGKRL